MTELQCAARDKSERVGRVGLVVIAATISINCSSVQEPKLERVASLALEADPVIAGYTHDLSRSRFRIGQAPSMEMSQPIQRWHGSLGAFAIDLANGFSYASIDATTSPGPYILDEASQAAQVKDYFVGAGLPADQIGEIQATYTSAIISMPTTDMSGSPPARLESITTILRRRLSGLLVVESEAWAKMTTSGEADLESVFWPPISAAIAQQAVTFANAMTDPAAHAAYLARLPGVVQRDVGVVIHHTDAGIEAAPIAFASYDAVLDSGGHSGTRPAARHFDANGAEFRLPQEGTAAASSQAPSTP